MAFVFSDGNSFYFGVRFCVAFISPLFAREKYRARMEKKKNHTVFFTVMLAGGGGGF